MGIWQIILIAIMFLSLIDVSVKEDDRGKRIHDISIVLARIILLNAILYLGGWYN